MNRFASTFAFLFVLTVVLGSAGCGQRFDDLGAGQPPTQSAFAADALTGHYRGEQLTLFVDPWTSGRAAGLRWLPSVDGPITLLRMFWPRGVERTLEKGDTRVAHPLLVDAELLFQGREREVETAKLVYDQYLRPNLGDA